jgi:hypothetical protein
MRNVFKALFSAPQAKASRAARLVAIESGGRARWTPRDYAALAREGFAVVDRAGCDSDRAFAARMSGICFNLVAGVVVRP